MDISYPVTKVDVQAAPEATVADDPAAAQLAGQIGDQLGGARIWHVNSTARGGGVAELLRTSIVRHRQLGLPADWLVADAEPEFFALTKRIHHGLHGRLGDGGFDPGDRELYRSATTGVAHRLTRFLRRGDVAVLHDPQTLGAAPHLIAAGVRVAWRCHIGTAADPAATSATWDVLRPYLEPLPRAVFTMAAFAPPFLPVPCVTTMPPSIDPSSAKNRELSPELRAGLLAAVGLTGPHGRPADPAPGHTVGRGHLPDGVPVVTQVSRWDPLKDMAGVLTAFADHVAPGSEAHLVLAGPDPADIPDDPEGAEVYRRVRRQWDRLPTAVQRRVHLVVLSLRDLDTNGLVVNAIQRRSTVVVQKSLEEGFGLTVTEAMWKRRPVVAARVGGLAAQIDHGTSGLLVDPTDLRAFGEAVRALLADADYATRLGEAAHRRCRRDFLAGRELVDHLHLYLGLLAERRPRC